MNIRQSMFLDDHPPVLLIHKMMSRQEILSLHQAGDCLVMPHKSEGWSCTHTEAMAMGKPAIGTKFGGNLEFMNEDNSFLLDYSLTPVSNMPWKLYSGKTMWAEPDLGQLKQQMRFIYENQHVAKQKGLLAKETIKQYDWPVIGQKIVDLLGV